MGPEPDHVLNISRPWNNDRVDDSTRASVQSLMIERIVATQHGTSEQFDISIRCHGLHISRERIRTPVRRREQLSYCESCCHRVVELGSGGGSRQDIADILNAEGYLPPRREFSTSVW